MLLRGTAIVMILLSRNPVEWFLLLVIVADVYFFLLTLSNVLFLRLKTRKPAVTGGPKVSILIPARNEEKNINRCLDSFVDQTYENYEIIVLDDGSTDRTWEIISEYERKYAQFRAIKGRELPDDWLGKPHAMHQLAQAASGEYYLFTDADTVHKSNVVSWAVTNILYHKVDLLSGYLKPSMRSFGEKVTVPNMFLNMAILIPFWLIPTTRLPLFSFAIGQLILFKAETYRKIGGYSCVRDKITEDVYIARKIKRLGFRMIFLDAKRHSAVRMYTGFTQAVNGMSKNIYDFFEKKLYPIIILGVFISAFLLLPVFFVFFQAVTCSLYLFPSVVSVGLFFITWAMVMWDREVSCCVSFLYPVLLLVLLVMAGKSVILDIRGGGYMWKGRLVR